MIFLNMLIPLLALAIMLVFFRSKINPTEYALIFGIPAAIIGICYWISYASQTTDTEYLSSYGATAIYEEAWDEEVPCTHGIYKTRKNKDGSTYEELVGYEHEYDVDDHRPSWHVIDNTGRRWTSNRSHFKQLCGRWDMCKFKDMHRDYHSLDGDMYISKFNGNFEDLEPYCRTKTYLNKVQASDSVFNELEVEPEDVTTYELFDYRKPSGQSYNPIYGYHNAKASHKLQSYNSLVGLRRQLTMLLCVYYDQPFDAGELQESYWNGGNKNEFIVCVGLSSNSSINWVKVISWTEVDILKQQTVSDIKAMGTFNAEDVVTYMGTRIPNAFIRKEFADFDYITIQPSGTARMVSAILTMLSTIAICTCSYFFDINFND